MKTISRQVLSFVFFFSLALSGCGGESAAVPGERFDGIHALTYVEQQMAYGPRIPGSSGHELTRNLIIDTLYEHGWEAEMQQGKFGDTPIYNIIGFRKTNNSKINLQQIIIGAHYDTRIFADHSATTEEQSVPVPGANDGASGVAVLLELSRVLIKYDHLDVQLVFFDAEDNGRISGWDWIIGSEQYAEALASQPNAVVIVDMIGDREQEIYWEKSSTPYLREEIWQIAADLGIDTFIPEEKYHILDDHTPFLQRGIDAVDVIDFDYPYWHTTEDTLDKVSASSLENVGVVLQEWLNFRDSLGE